MTLADVSLPVQLAWTRQHALVFSAVLAVRLAQVQDEVGDPRYLLTPQPLIDGRYMTGADLLTECIPSGFLFVAFSRLDSGRFNEIAVVPIQEALDLLPPDPPMDE